MLDTCCKRLRRLQPHHLILHQHLTVKVLEPSTTTKWNHIQQTSPYAPCSGDSSLIILYSISISPSKTLNLQQQQSDVTYSKPHPTPHALATPASSSYSLLHQYLTVKVFEPSKTTKWCHIQQTLPHAPATPASSSYSLLHQHLTVKVLEPSTTTKWHHTQQTSTHAPLHGTGKCDSIITITRGQSNLTKSASREAHSPVRGHPRGSKFVPLNSWGRGSY